MGNTFFAKYVATYAASVDVKLICNGTKSSVGSKNRKRVFCISMDSVIF